jgi:hypothetical protein
VSPERRARIRTQVRASRQRQGLPAHVTDPAILDRLAGRLLERVAERTEVAWAGEGEPMATRWGQKREAGQHAS